MDAEPSRPRDETLAALEREVGVLMRRTRRVVAERARLVHPDLHPAAYLMLTVLAKRGPLRPSEVSEFFALDKGAVSRQVHQLVDLGLVTRSPDPDDRRATILSLTETAQHEMGDSMCSRRARLRDQLADWEDDALVEFVTLLGRYNAALERD